MATSGSGTGTAVSSGVAGAATIAQPLPYTLLALPRYAKIMGINPAHFSRATASSDGVFPVGTCNDVWPRYSWQNSDQVSHEDLARAIYDAEHDIAKYLGYHPAPRWIAAEMHSYPRFHRREYYGGGGNVRGQFKSVNTNYDHFIRAGRRAVTLVDTATVAGGGLQYLDLDGDGMPETARVTATTSLSNACEVKVYFVGKGGAAPWEIRPVRSKSISGGTYTADFDSWLFIDPDLLEAYPNTSDDFRAIDISTTANFVTSVDVYREYTDTTVAASQFYWEREPVVGIDAICPSCSGSGCEACTLITQDGCLQVRNVPLGIAAPIPATYDSDNAQWNKASWVECREPDQVKIWYYAGDLSEEYLRDENCDPLSDFWAHPIAWIATARLERPFCSCGNMTALADHLRVDLATSSSEESRFTPDQILNNPFGTRQGEVQAWQRVSKYGEKVYSGRAV